MYESEEPSFSAVVERVRTVNGEIDAVLAAFGPLSESEIDLLGSKLQERGECLDFLQNRSTRLVTEASAVVKHQVATFWNEFCKELRDDDEVRLAGVKQRMNETADAVRLIRKRQLLLQYR